MVAFGYWSSSSRFTGWAAGGGWSDLGFYMEHGDHLERIAIVADARWQDALMLFANADLRRRRSTVFRTGRDVAGANLARRVSAGAVSPITGGLLATMADQRSRARTTRSG